MLVLDNLRVAVSEKEILRGVNLRIKSGEIHVLMGMNGAGKSTLARAIMGAPELELSGKILFLKQDISAETPDKRARRGIFMSFQSPEEVPGISLESFLRTAKKSYSGDALKLIDFQDNLEQALGRLDINPKNLRRDMNVGFSGGEKKKNEILQLELLQPKLAILDEIDSGLDVDAVQNIAKSLLRYKTAKNSLILITHSARLANMLPVDQVHIMRDGVISESGDKTLIKKIDTQGFRKK